MNHIFEINDKTGRKIHLSKERWGHIRMEHPEIVEPYEIEEVIKNPLKIIQSDRDENVKWYFRHDKIKRRYLKVSVKYLNGDGYIITAHHTTRIE